MNLKMEGPSWGSSVYGVEIKALDWNVQRALSKNHQRPMLNVWAWEAIARGGSHSKGRKPGESVVERGAMGSECLRKKQARG